MKAGTVHTRSLWETMAATVLKSRTAIIV